MQSSSSSEGSGREKRRRHNSLDCNDFQQVLVLRRDKLQDKSYILDSPEAAEMEVSSPIKKQKNGRLELLPYSRILPLKAFATKLKEVLSPPLKQRPTRKAQPMKTYLASIIKAAKAPRRRERAAHHFEYLR